MVYSWGQQHSYARNGSKDATKWKYRRDTGKSAKSRKDKEHGFKPWWTSRQRPKEMMQECCSGFRDLAQKLRFGQACEEFCGRDSSFDLTRRLRIKVCARVALCGARKSENQGQYRFRH